MCVLFKDVLSDVWTLNRPPVHFQTLAYSPQFQHPYMPRVIDASISTAVSQCVG